MRYRVLAQLEQTKDYISGERLGDLFEVSRSAIWKSIVHLREEGYNIRSTTNKGYILLENESDIINRYELQKESACRYMGKTVCCYDTLPSTNDEAKRLIREKNVDEGTVVVALSQTEGRGRLGRKWYAPPNEGINLSLVLTPKNTPLESSIITLLMGLGVCRGIQNVTGIPCAIKWPNDILVGTKKIAGILTEMTLEGETIQSAVVGIGINVQTQQFPPELETIATSVYAETGEKHKRARLIQEILLQIERIYDEYMALGNCDSLLTQYKACCMTLSKTVRVIYKKEEREGVATDISAMGGLIVETASGETLHVHAGEVSIREA